MERLVAECSISLKVTQSKGDSSRSMYGNLVHAMTDKAGCSQLAEITYVCTEINFPSSNGFVKTMLINGRDNLSMKLGPLLCSVSTGVKIWQKIVYRCENIPLVNLREFVALSYSCNSRP